MNKTDYIWLTRNTEISNVVNDVADCDKEDLVLRLYRKHHLARLKQIFTDYKTELYADENDYFQLKIKGFTLKDFCYCAQNFRTQQILNIKDGRTYYIPVDKSAKRRVLNHTNPRILANLPTHKKLDILLSICQKCYVSETTKIASENALARKTDKLLALLQLKISSSFMEDELRKVRLITAEIAQIPRIQKYLENFATLSLRKQKELLKKTCEISAKYNKIEMPKLCFLTEEDIAKDCNIAQWANVDAYSYEKNVVINQDKLKHLSGAQALSLAWHETTHVAQGTGDYSAYPLVELMFNENLGYLQEMSETYLFHPQEQVVYALEKQFIENLVENTKIKTNDSTFSFASEYNIATQYLHRAMQRKL